MLSPEPIAIVGMACRFAGGVHTPAQFWELLRTGRHVIGEVPPERWQWYARQSPAHAAAVADTPKAGGFLDDIKGFDAEFFDITPREAALMDPQQRIVLELSWEALEHAGLPPRDLAGTDAGVFMGVGADDYGRRLLEDLPSIEAWTGIGGAYCAVANRVSHALDLRGPSVAVDTACSSSLVAIHLAAQALRAGECPVALAGGVLVMAAPGLSRVLDAAGATAPDGRSKSFDAAADGYGRGEGGGVVVLKRLRDAERDGDRVLAVIRGSGVHQDGRTNGIMAPDAGAQAHLLRRTYDAAGVDPASIGYVEAHGTGTRVGDPLEAAAMAAVFGTGRTGVPCLIGSVKPNIGHLEAGAGVAGVIKAVLALRHGTIPASLNVTRPNPAVDWEKAGLRVATENTVWPHGRGPRRAGVSGYGYGGTLAHVILEAAPPATAHEAPEGAGVYPVSAASPQALSRQAARLADRLAADPSLRTADVGRTMAVRRSHLAHRAAVVAADPEELVTGLRRIAAGERGTITGGSAGGTSRGMVWVFSGHGSQWIGMGRQLLKEDRAFAEVVDRLEPVFAEELGLSLRGLLGSDDAKPVDVVQPMIYAVQVALAAAWRALGVRPDAVLGHSVGEIAAAVTAGMLTAEQGARLVCRRSVLLRPVLGGGAMAMVNIAPPEARRRLDGRDDVVVAIAASPGWTVISGLPAAVAEVTEQWRADGFAVRAIDSDVAFHSPQMDPLLDELKAAVADLPPAPGRLPVYSSALDDPRSDAPRDGAYWALNLRGQVRFAEAVTAAVEDGYRLFVEVSPHPVVAHSVTDTLSSIGVPDAYVGVTLRRNRPERQALLTGLAHLYCHGASIDWTAVWPAGELVDLPTTAWQHKPYWAPEPAIRTAGDPHDPATHTLLGRSTVVHGTSPVRLWTTTVDLRTRPYPGRHPVRDVEIVPAAVLLNTFLTAASAGRRWAGLADVALRVPVSLTRARDVQVSLQDGTLHLSSRVAEDDDDRSWLTHTVATVGAPGDPAGDPGPGHELGEVLPASYVQDRLAGLGVGAMGFAWTVTGLRRGPGRLAATVELPGGPAGPHSWAPMLDAALSIASVVFGDPPVLRMPAHLVRLTLSPTAPRTASISVRQTDDSSVDVHITGPDGEAVGHLRGLRYGVLEADPDGRTDPARLVHGISWSALRLPVPQNAAATRRVILVGPPSPARARLRAAFGEACRLADGPENLRPADLTSPTDVVVVPPASAVDAGWLLARTAQRLSPAGASARARLWCVTRGVREGRTAVAVEHSALWGLGRVIGGEHPGLWGGVVDLACDTDAETVPAVVRSAVREDIVAIEDGRAEVARLRLLDHAPVRPATECRPDATYLITGGLGALGLTTAHWLVNRGARRIVLVSRQGLPPRDRWNDIADPELRARVDGVLALERLGVTVVVAALDISDAAAAHRLLSPGALGLPPIRGVVHAAGTVDNRLLRDLDRASLRRVTRPKIDGARVLHGLFPPGSVDFFVLFSSAGQLLGLPGQASYAAGNAFLDGLARHRHRAGDRGSLSIAWTSWRGLGMSTSSEVIDVELAARGTADITAEEALAAWDRLAGMDVAEATVLRVLPEGPGRTPLLRDLAVATDSPAPATEPPQWAGLEGVQRHAALVSAVVARIAGETGLPAAEVDVLRPLAEMGVDSLMSTRIRHRLDQDFGVTLPATLLWDQPTVDRIARYAGEVLDITARDEEGAA